MDSTLVLRFADLRPGSVLQIPERRKGLLIMCVAQVASLATPN